MLGAPGDLLPPAHRVLLTAQQQLFLPKTSSCNAERGRDTRRDAGRVGSSCFASTPISPAGFAPWSCSRGSSLLPLPAASLHKSSQANAFKMQHLRKISVSSGLLHQQHHCCSETPKSPRVTWGWCLVPPCQCWLQSQPQQGAATVLKPISSCHQFTSHHSPAGGEQRLKQ